MLDFRYFVVLSMQEALDDVYFTIGYMYKTPEIIKLLRDSVCIQLDFGVESGSPKLLKT